MKSGLMVAKFIDKPPSFQNLINPSWDDEIREEREENTTEVISLVCPVKFSIMWGD